MKKYLLGLAIALLIATPVSSYVIEKGDTPYKLWGLNWVQEMENQIGHSDQYHLPTGVEVSLGEELLGAVAIPTDNYDSFLTSPLSASASTVYVNALPIGVSTTIYTIFATDGTTPREKIYCTSKATNPNRLTGCVRGISFVPIDGIITEDAGTGLSHSKNARIAITDNINFSGKALNILYGNQVTGSTTLDVGVLSTTSIRLYADSNYKYFYSHNGDANEPFLRYNEGLDMWQWSENGTDTYNFTSSTISQLTASTTKGIGVTDSKIYINASSTAGITFDSSGALYQKTSSTAGILTDSNGLYVDGDYVVLDTDTTSTPTANSIPIWKSNGQLSVSSTPIDSTDATSKLYVDSLKFTDKLFISTTAYTLTNSTVETTVASVSVPGGSLGTNNAIRGKVAVTALVAGSNSHTLTIKVKYGATTMLTTDVTFITGAAADKGFYEFYIYADNSTSAQYANGQLLVFTDRSAADTAPWATQFDVGTATEDSITDKDLVVTVDWSDANVADSITVKGVIFELIQ